MLLENEIKVGEVYVNDKSIVIYDDEKVSLWQLVKAPEVKSRMDFMSSRTEEYQTQPVWENVFTGELIDWGTHCFTTIDRIKKQYANIEKLTKKGRAEYIKDAMAVIEEYAKLTQKQFA